MRSQNFKKKLQGYISSGNIGKNFYPQKIQNLCLKNYCDTNNYLLILSATEFKMKNSNLVLKGIIEKFKNYDGILFFSIKQLDDKKFRTLKYIIEAKKEIHFYYENIKLKNKNDFKKVSFLKKINKLLQHSSC
jgi:sporadic carbohydrate cluster protein (TIGR04323 family)